MKGVIPLQNLSKPTGTAYTACLFSDQPCILKTVPMGMGWGDHSLDFGPIDTDHVLGSNEHGHSLTHKVSLIN